MCLTHHHCTSGTGRKSIGGNVFGFDGARLMPFEESYAILQPIYAAMGIDLPPRKEHTFIMAGEWLKKRAVSAADAQRSKTLKIDAGDLKAYPALVDFLCADAWPDGTERKPGTLLIFADAGKFKGCLSDRDQALVLFFTVDSLALVMEAADDVLRAEDADWRPAKGGSTRRSGK